MANLCCKKEGMSMIYDLQRASLLKRISAWLLDTILLCIAATLMAFLLSAAVDYDGYSQRLDARYAHFEVEYGVSREVTQAQVDAMSPEELANLEAASKAIAEDEEALYVYNMMIQLVILITSLGILFAYLLLEFIVPMSLGNGQTIGKKVFAIGVMRQEGVKVNGVCMFIRTILGKYTIETMIPVLILLMLYFGTIGLTGTLVLLAIAVLQIGLMIGTHNNAAIHDVMAKTVAVDLASQMIFDTYDQLLEYKKKMHAEKAASQPY